MGRSILMGTVTNLHGTTPTGKKDRPGRPLPAAAEGRFPSSVTDRSTIRAQKLNGFRARGLPGGSHSDR
jgi:hypothetical protein